MALTASTRMFLHSEKALGSRIAQVWSLGNSRNASVQLPRLLAPQSTKFEAIRNYLSTNHNLPGKDSTRSFDVPDTERIKIDTTSSPVQEQVPSFTQESTEQTGSGTRLPRNVQAVYLRPLKRHAKHGVPSCDLQLRSYNVRNLEFFADFALRAAYYLNLPASGPIPLPRIVERWTVPRSNFVHKKSQENFERITLRRLVQIQDSHPEAVEVWLAFLRKHAYYGVGMKANIWELDKLGVGETMDVSLENSKNNLEAAWAHFGRNKNVDTSERVMEMMNNADFRRIDNGPFIH